MQYLYPAISLPEVSVMNLLLLMDMASPSILNQSFPFRSLIVQSSPEKENSFSLNLRTVGSFRTYFSLLVGRTTRPVGWPAMYLA